MKMRILSANELGWDTILDLFHMAEDFRLQDELNRHRNDAGVRSNLLNGCIVGSMFLEPSTRTRWSFEAAALRLGGNVVSAHSSSSSSLEKGETLEDTLNTVANYVDVLILRCPEPLFDASPNHPNFCIPSDVAFINAGDGNNEHPTQALLDAYTIWRRFERVGDLNIGVVGDLPESRAIHSFVKLLGSKMTNNFTTYCPIGFDIPDKFFPLTSSIHYKKESDFDEHLPEFDVLYLNRMQEERRGWGRETGQCELYKMGFDKLDMLDQQAIVMNPGPRRDEMPIISDPKVIYQEQTRNGMYMRMALLCWLFGVKP